MKPVAFTAVILAAGEGRRAGGYKPLWRIADRALIDIVIEAASSTCAAIRVVGGACFGELAAHVRESHPEVVPLENRDWQAGGMFSSVRAGVAGVTGPCFVHPVDVPGAGAEVYRALAAAYRAEPHEVLRPAFAGRAGHPVLLAPGVLAAIAAAPASATLRDVLAGRPRRDVPVADDLVLLDCDTKNDFDSLERRLARRAVGRKEP